jgi:hypothetical protein
MTMSVVTSVSTVGSKKLPPNLYADGGGALAAGDDFGALLDDNYDVRLDPLDRLHADQRTDYRAWLEPVGNLHGTGSLGEVYGQTHHAAGGSAIGSSLPRMNT